jgi:hypothetical protein
MKFYFKVIGLSLFAFCILLPLSASAAAPSFFAGNIFDSNGDGTVDRINIVFTSGFNTADLSASEIISDWTYTGGSIGGTLGIPTAPLSSTIISFPIDGANVGVTGGQMPTMSYNNDDADDSISNGDGAMGNIGPISLNDGANPVVVSAGLSPADNAVGVAISTDLVVTFSEATNVGSGDVIIRKVSDDVEVAVIDVSGEEISGGGSNTITMQLTETLYPEIEYYVLIDDTAFEDSSLHNYIGISDSTEWNFTTVDAGDSNSSIIASPNSATINENAGNEEFTFQLDEPIIVPAESPEGLTLRLISSNSNEMTLSTNILRWEANEWDQERSVTVTGVNEGTASLVWVADTAAEYYSGLTGSIEVTVTIPPSLLSYTSLNSYTLNSIITPLVPTLTGTVDSYVVSPALPAGLVIDPFTGVISGTPMTVTGTTTYTVTATNELGETTFDIDISVAVAAEDGQDNRSGNNSGSGGRSLYERIEYMIERGKIEIAKELIVKEIKDELDDERPSIQKLTKLIEFFIELSPELVTEEESDNKELMDGEMEIGFDFVTKLNGVTRDLYLEAEGDDVVLLQEFLIEKGTGPSSAELENIGVTGYFGNYTKNALSEFQQSFGIEPSIGYFGSITRDYIVRNY